MIPQKRILLIEDNADDETLTILAFRENNIANDVFVARDGAEALDYLFCTGKYADRDPDDLPALVLLDLKLPKIPGLEVLRRLRADPRTELLPVVVLTTSSEERDLVESYKLRCNSYIQKPVDLTQFMGSVRQLGLYWLVLNKCPPGVRLTT